MKKHLLALCVTFLTVSLFADVSVGFKAKANYGIGTTLDDSFRTSMENEVGPMSVDSLWGGGWDFYLNVSMGWERFQVGIQPEVGFSFYNGVECLLDGFKDTIYYSTVDLPVLATVKVGITERVFLHAGAGAQLSIPYRPRNKFEWNGWHGRPHDWEWYGMKLNGVEFGLVGEVGVGFMMKKGEIVANVRYLYNLNSTKGEIHGVEFDFMKRKTLSISGGYHFIF